MQADYESIPKIPISVGRVLKRSLFVLGKSFVPIMVLMLFMHFPLWFPFLLAGVPLEEYLARLGEAPLGQFGYPWGEIIFALCFSVAHIGIIYIVYGRLMDAPTGIMQTVKNIFSRLIPFWRLVIPHTFLLLLGFSLFLVPGLLLLTIWAVAWPACLVEEKKAFDSLQRSSWLTKFNRGKVGLSLIAGLVASGVALLPFMLLAEWGWGAGAIPITLPCVIAISLLQLAGLAYAFIIPTVLYVELRDAREGFLQDLTTIFD